jgi:hypothetical protein
MVSRQRLCRLTQEGCQFGPDLRLVDSVRKERKKVKSFVSEMFGGDMVRLVESWY